MAPERLVDLGAQVPDVDVDDVGAALVGEIPGVLEEVEPGEDLLGPSHERLEQRELLRRQIDLGITAPDPPRRRVEPQVTDLENGGALEIAAAC